MTVELMLNFQTAQILGLPVPPCALLRGHALIRGCQREQARGLAAARVVRSRIAVGIPFPDWPLRSH